MGFFLLMSFGLGCSSTSLVSSDQSKTFYTYETFNEKMKGDNIEVFLRDSSKSLIKDIHAGPDSVTWYNIEKSQRQSVATMDVNRVEYVSHWGGAAEGLLIGGGGAAALILALNGNSTSGWQFYGAVAYGGLGGLLGLGVGAAIGHTSKYHFMLDSAQSVK